ncbi:MAG: response regulator [Deltaproteobacteria bacterium]
MPEAPARKIRVLVVDDTSFMRRALVEILSRDNEIEVAGVARHGLEALEAVAILDPDVITLDVDMPVMDGITAMKHIMVRYPKPVVMVSGLAHRSAITLDALRLGAVDFFPKPSGTISLDIHEQAESLARIVKIAAGVEPAQIRRARLHLHAGDRGWRDHHAAGVVVIAVGKGGAAEFMRILSQLDVNLPLAVLAHLDMVPELVRSYGAGLKDVFAWPVYCCTEIDEICVAGCYLAPWARFRGIEANGGGCFRLKETFFDFIEYARNLSCRPDPPVMFVRLGVEGADGNVFDPLARRFVVDRDVSARIGAFGRRLYLSACGRTGLGSDGPCHIS